MDLDAFLRPPAPPRETFTDHLREYFEGDDSTMIDVESMTEQQLEDSAARLEAMAKSEGFRLESPGYQVRLDQHLWEYRVACCLYLTISNRQDELLSRDTLSSANDHLFFPLDDLDAFFTFCKHYFIWAVQKVKPRKRKDVHPKLSSIHTRRWSLLSWARRKMGDKCPTHKTFLSRTNQALHFAARDFGVNKKRDKQVCFGRHELRYLSEHDLARTDSIELAESMQLAWHMACICGVRPGSLGFVKLRPDNYLRWKSVTITRDINHKERFIVDIEFPYLKGFNDDDGLGGGILNLRVMPPQNADNIPLSISYRMLIMLLRRGFLDQYTTPEQLLAGNELNIRIAKEHLEKPIFLAGTPGGRGLSDKACSADALTSYLSLRASECGFKDAYMKAWRSGAATKVSEAYGPDVARGFLNHRPDSHILEDHYLDKHSDLDVARIAYGEDHQAGRKEMQQISAEVLYRAEMLLTPAQQEDAVLKYVERYLPAAGTKNERRRLTRIARQEIRLYAMDMFKRTFTAEQLQERIKQLDDKSKFLKELEARARARRSQAEDSLFVQEDEDLQDEEYDDENGPEDEGFDAGAAARVRFADDSNEDAAQHDPTDETSAQAKSSENQMLEVSTDGPADVGTIAELPYKAIALEFCHAFLEGKLTSGERRPCPECLIDDTASEEHKNKIYKGDADLRKHTSTNFHTKMTQWLRRMKQLQGQDTEGKFRCEAKDCPGAFAQLGNLSNHIAKLLDAEPTNEEGRKNKEAHVDMARKIGRLDRDWDIPMRDALERARLGRTRATNDEVRLGKRKQAEALLIGRPAKFPSSETPQSIAYVGPPSQEQAERQKQLLRSSNVLQPGQTQRPLHELAKAWPVPLTNVTFGALEPEEEAKTPGQRLREALLRNRVNSDGVRGGNKADRKPMKF